MMSDVLAIPLARKNWMAFCCIGPENLRGAMIIDAPSMFPPGNARLAIFQ
jgi:hypothetical protein